MSDPQVRVRLDERSRGTVATVTVGNSRLNSMNRALMTEFVAALAGLASNPALRALIVTGAGDKAFIGGADIREMQALANGDEARAFISQVHQCCAAVRAVPVPTIARIQGFALGAGFELAASCDLRVASETALFGMPEVKLGLPSVIEAALLPSIVGWGRTRQILLLGERFDAAQARAWNFVEEVVPPERLDAAVETWVGQVLTGAPRAIRLQKDLIRAWEALPLDAAIEAGINAFAAAYATDEPATTMAEFLALLAERNRPKG